MQKEVMSKMTIHEFGKEHNKTVILIHPACVMWDYFEYVITYLPETQFKVFDEIGHAGLALKNPEVFADEIIRICERSSKND